jgi:RNA polymerase sigma-70 factor (ECF subfamily)
MQIDSVKARKWPTTHWSLVDLAGSEGASERRQALTSLIQIYMPVLRRHLLSRRGVRPDQVDDLLQSFVLSKLLEQDILRLADQSRGKFRTFLATAIDRFVLNSYRDQNASKRGGQQPAQLSNESNVRDDQPAPVDTFTYAWACQVLGQSIRRMRVACDTNHRPEVWAIFRGRILMPCLRNRQPVAYVDLVAKFGLRSPSQASNVLITANRMFARELRNTIGAYQRDEQDIESEIRDLWQAVSRGGAGRRRNRGSWSK